jgi:NAD-dependent deacetylase
MDPDRTWQAIAALARRAVAAQPNAGHRALAQIEDKVQRFVLLTQNVDGLHQLGGSRNVIDIHGDIRRTRCLGCSLIDTLPREDLPRIERAPRCRVCGGVLRPDVVLFGELLPEDGVRRMREEFYTRPPDLVLVAGTTAMFPYIAEPVLHARGRGDLTVEVNPEPTDLSDRVDYSLRGPAGSFLPAIARAL